MAFCLVVGTHDLHGQLEGYENVQAQCHNCGNWSAHVMTEFPMFSICFIPVIPMALHKYKLVACPICNYKQDLSTRPDVQSQAHGGGSSHPPPPGPYQNPQGYQQQGYQQQQQQGGYYPQK